MNKMFKCWVHKPDNLAKCFLIVLPIIFSQILQRLYPIIDNRYLSILGNEALYIHSIQYNFVTFGQFIGLATYISCLVFWKRKECLNKQGSILIKHISAAGLFTLFFAIFAWVFSSSILTYYKVDQTYLPLATVYLKIGLLNMVLQAIYGGLDGMLVGSQQQKYSMYIAMMLVTFNIIFDQYAVNVLFSGENNTIALYSPMVMIGISTTLLLIGANIISLILVLHRIQGWNRFSLKEMLPVWWGELGSYLIRGIVPLIFGYQLSLINTSSRFLVTYQLALHLSYLFCIPAIGALQIAVRDAGASENQQNYTSLLNPPKWWNVFLYTGFIPSTILLALGAFSAVPIMLIIYHYVTPLDHIGFLVLFFIGCWIGQCGNTLTIPLRAAKKSYLVTKNFFISEFAVMLLGTQLLIFFDMATPIAIGYMTLLFASAYCLSNLRDVYILNKNQKIELVYEKIN